MLAVAAWGAMLQHRAAGAGHETLPRPGNLAWVYLPLLLMEWGLVLYVVRGGARAGTSVRDLIGGRWARPMDVARDLLLAAGIWGVWTLASLGIDHVLAADHAASPRSLLPHRPLEILMWIALSLSAGFSEELVFRGYFQSQFLAFTHRIAFAVALQAALFGITHGYQGVRACATITLYGVIMGVVAARRKSLRPGMIAHAWTDIASGIFRI